MSKSGNLIVRLEQLPVPAERTRVVDYKIKRIGTVNNILGPVKSPRTGAPMTYTIHDKGLSTMIDWRDRPTGTKGVSADQRIELYKLRKWQRRVRVSDATERNLAVALSELSKLSSALSLPKTILETASVIYRRAIKRRLIRGRSIH